MAPVTVTTEVARPAEAVFAYATDPGRFAEWQQGVISGHQDGGTPEVGTRCRTVRRIGFADRPVTSEIVHLDPPRSWRLHGVDGPIRALVDVTVVPLPDDSARLTIAVDFEGRGIGRLLVPLVVRRQAAREMPANVATLRRRLEAAG